ncbi:protein SCO2 homolog, mitochondrial-like [Biomphalaria glabrata]|uniref:Protein SCO2 homolog, mitochondrial-like n=1 Tax=Biomphalaria glabrata TaxID=6526 RepID=A0A9U8E2G8_BIOGL|nr:protein SCO2 homolog, mitochondrial-like [Biomphalaria glabrata]
MIKIMTTRPHIFLKFHRHFSHFRSHLDLIPKAKQVSLRQFCSNSRCMLLTSINKSWSSGSNNSYNYRSCQKYTTSSENSNKKSDGTVNIPWWGRLLIVSSIGAGVYYTYKSAEHEKELDNELYRYKEFEKINLGGDWTLIDHNGNKRSSTDFRGQWIIMYMGFTHCPDICPEEMEKLGTIVKTFDNSADLPKLQPVFITLDPERDTPAVIKDYLKDFTSPRIVGFTGTEEEIKEVAKKFRAYFGKGPKDQDNDYIVDHTIIIYLINPKGEFVNYYSRSRTATEVIQSVTKHIEKYNELEKR